MPFDFAQAEQTFPLKVRLKTFQVENSVSKLKNVRFQGRICPE